MFQSLQAGRGLAALLVVFFHLNGSIWGKERYFTDQFFRPFGFGNAGVQFFFVLSGFIIFYVHNQDVDDPGRLARFAKKRFFRVYPIYWVILAAIIPAAFLVAAPGAGGEIAPAHVITTVLLLPYPQDPILDVAWTLRHEVLFYFMFALCIWHKRLGLIFVTAWMTACVTALALPHLPFPLDFLTSPNNILFALGIGVAYGVGQQRGFGYKTAVFAGATIFLATGLHRVYADQRFGPSVYVLLFGAGSALAIFGLVGIEMREKLNVPKSLLFLGDASYAIYLINFPALSMIAKVVVAAGLRSRVPEYILFWAMFCTAVGFGCLLHLYIERPLLEWLNKRPSPADAPART